MAVIELGVRGTRGNEVLTYKGKTLYRFALHEVVNDEKQIPFIDGWNTTTTAYKVFSKYKPLLSGHFQTDDEDPKIDPSDPGIKIIDHDDKIGSRRSRPNPDKKDDNDDQLEYITQATYKLWPLYTFEGDTLEEEEKGTVGGFWEPVQLNVEQLVLHRDELHRDKTETYKHKSVLAGP